MGGIQMKPFNRYFDHTLLKADATNAQFLKLFSEAAQHDFAAVCVNGCHVRSARRFFNACGRAYNAETDEGVRVATVIGFPLGAMATNAKAYEAQLAIDDGADEIDMVMNIGAARDGNWAYIEDEIYAIGEMCHEDGVVLKVIIETCLLSDDEIVEACLSAAAAGADFVKTSTGFASPAECSFNATVGHGGATAHAVGLMRRTVDDYYDTLDEDEKANRKPCQVKASGGIRALKDAREMIDAGADRLGCSASVQILEEAEK